MCANAGAENSVIIEEIHKGMSKAYLQGKTSQITLLNTAGSKVLLGNMLVVPVNQSLLFIRPLYVQAVNTPQPQFKKAIVVYGDRAVMQNTLKDALESIFGSAPPTLEQNAGQGAQPPAPGTAAPTPSAPGPAPNVRAILDQAAAAFNDAQDALKAGDLARYQSDVNKGAGLVRQAQQASGNSGGGTSAPSSPSSTPPTTTASA